MILDDIKNKLKEVDNNVFYGAVDPRMREEIWDYIVFARDTLSYSESKKSYGIHYTVAIVRENFIPEGLEMAVINKMCEIPGMRVSGSDGNYEYIPKPNTNNIVEMLTINFVKPIKV